MQHNSYNQQGGQVIQPCQRLTISEPVFPLALPLQSSTAEITSWNQSIRSMGGGGFTGADSDGDSPPVVRRPIKTAPSMGTGCPVSPHGGGGPQPRGSQPQGAGSMGGRDGQQDQERAGHNSQTGGGGNVRSSLPTSSQAAVAAAGRAALRRHSSDFSDSISDVDYA